MYKGIFIPWDLYIHVEPIRFSPRNDTFPCCKWKAVSRLSIIYCSAFDSLQLSRLPRLPSSAPFTDSHFATFQWSLLQQSQKQYLPSPIMMHSSFVCLTLLVSTHALTSFSSLRVRISPWDQSTVSRKSLTMIVDLGP